MQKPAKVLSIMCLLGGAAVLRADTTTPPVAPPPSITEMTVKSGEIKTKIESDYQHVLYIKEQAKKAKDVIKLSCVNDKLVQVKAQMNIADEANDQLQAALARGADERVGYFQTLSTTGSAIHVLRESAATCIGEPELYKQEAAGSYTKPETPDDPTQTPESGNDGTFEPPAYASPYR
jgi:hypothetical protein